MGNEGQWAAIGECCPNERLALNSNGKDTLKRQQKGRHTCVQEGKEAAEVKKRTEQKEKDRLRRR